MTSNPQRPTSIIYQAGKLGDVAQLLDDIALAQRLAASGTVIGRLYGNASGALVAVAHAVQIGAQTAQAGHALDDLAGFFEQARSRDIRRLNVRHIQYGFYHLGPLRKRLAALLAAWTGLADPSALTLADLPVPVYLCAADKDAYPVFFGPPDNSLRAVYHNCATRLENAPVLDACIAAVSTMLSTDAARVNGHFYKDGRPVFADISPMVLDMEAGDPRPIVKSEPHTPLPAWKPWAASQVFIMHRWHERNQATLSRYYNDLLLRQRALAAQANALQDALAGRGVKPPPAPPAPRIQHVRLPYIGSTEASTNMRTSIANKTALMAEFRALGEPQLDGFDFAQPMTLIYGAGGFSGMVAEMVMAGLIDARGAQIERIFGCSAGVLNGLFHAVALGARRRPDLYTPDAHDALRHLEQFFEQLDPSNLYRMNHTPRRLVRAVANSDPLREQIARYLERWTGCADGTAVTFEDLALPFYAVGARGRMGPPTSSARRATCTCSLPGGRCGPSTARLSTRW